MNKVDVEISDIEIGYSWLTVWCRQREEMLELAPLVYHYLPKEIQELNKPDLSDHNPKIYHPYGQGPSTGRRYFNHFHIICPEYDDVFQTMILQARDLRKLLINLTTTKHKDLVITEIHDHVDESMTESDKEQAFQVALTEFLRDRNREKERIS